MGACFLVRRRAYDEVGRFDERYFLFSEEVDWMRRAARCRVERRLHAEGALCPRRRASHGGRMFRENVRGHLRYLALHGRPGEAERAAGCCGHRSSSAAACTAASARASTGTAAAWLGSGDVDGLLAG